VDGFGISELAGRTGFSASAVRYYERVGVLPPAARLDNGYRVYEPSSVARLRFVARAKSLGLGLDETRELAALWSGAECGPVQVRLAALLASKRDAAEAQIAGLFDFLRDLEIASAHMEAQAPDGPCDDDCACLAESRTGHEEPAIACSLEPGDATERLAAWRSVLDEHSAIDVTASGVRIRFDVSVDAGSIARLAQEEQRCCAFLRFAIAITRSGVTLDIQGPHDARPVIDAITGIAS
jgi:DNA-binding transcriptional MerR regulator